MLIAKGRELKEPEVSIAYGETVVWVRVNDAAHPEWWFALEVPIADLRLMVAEVDRNGREFDVKPCECQKRTSSNATVEPPAGLIDDHPSVCAVWQALAAAGLIAGLVGGLVFAWLR